MYDEKHRYKMYKSGKRWIIGTITTVSCVLGGMTFGKQELLHADTLSSNNASSSVVKSSSASTTLTTQKSIALKSSASSQNNISSAPASQVAVKKTNTMKQTSSAVASTAVSSSQSSSSTTAPGKAVPANEDDQATQVKVNGHWYLKNQQGENLTGFQYIK